MERRLLKTIEEMGFALIGCFEEVKLIRLRKV
jgi:hypothetical protein